MTPERRGSIPLGWAVFLASVAIVVTLCGLLAWTDRAPQANPYSATAEPLIVYCAASIKPTAEAIARRYEQEFGATCELQFGASQTLLTNIEVSRRGDLYLPADDSYLGIARDKHLLAESVPLAQMKPALAVRRDSGLQVRSLTELLASSATIAQAEPEAAAIGKLTRQALERSGQWTVLAERTKVFEDTVGHVANAVKLGAVDAGIVWDAMQSQYTDLEFIPLPELADVTANVAVAVLETSRQPEAARKLARYFGARDRGLEVFRRNGCETVAGAAWADAAWADAASANPPPSAPGTR